MIQHVLGRWADDLFLHGHDLVRWITDYVDLEESLAVGSMAQEELSHAAALLMSIGIDAVERDQRLFVRPLPDWAPPRLLLRPATTWPDTVARSLLFSEATATLIGQLRQRGDDALAATASVVGAEQALHVRHWHRWVRILVRDRRTDDELLAALHARAGECDDLFAPAPGEEGDDTFTGVLVEDWGKRVLAALIALGAGDVDLPDPAAQRTPLPAGSEVAVLLERVRSIRVEHPDRRYEIYA